VWWLLESDNAFVAIPQGAPGEEKLIERLQQLPHFDNDAMSNAMRSTSNQRFICWSKI
jgi:hypothetical protein